MPKKIDSGMPKAAKAPKPKDVIKSPNTKKQRRKPAPAVKKNNTKRDEKHNLLGEIYDIPSTKSGNEPKINLERIETKERPEKKFIDISQEDKDEARKIKITWSIVAIVGVLFLALWFWSIKNNLKEPLTPDFSQLSQKTGEAITELKQALNAENLINTPTSTASSTDIQKVKEEVLLKLQTSLDVGSWPSHTSEILGVTINFPPDWSKKEDSKSLTIATASSSSPSTSLSITKIANSKNTALSAWTEKNQNLFAGYELSDDSATIGNKSAITYNKEGSNSSTTDSIIFTAGDKSIYQINIYNNQPLNQIILDNIISSIIFKSKAN